MVVGSPAVAALRLGHLPGEAIFSGAAQIETGRRRKKREELMQIPSAMFIESAADSLKAGKTAGHDDQQRELSEFGDVRAQAIGASGLSNDFRRGYELGLETAREMIFTNVALRRKGVVPEDVL
jgi:hypothetical protein